MSTTAPYPAPLETPIRGSAPNRRCHLLERPALDVVIPVLDEERVLRQSTLRLHRHLQDVLRVPFAITIVDNGSTDATPEIAAQLACEVDAQTAIDDLSGVRRPASAPRAAREPVTMAGPDAGQRSAPHDGPAPVI